MKLTTPSDMIYPDTKQSELIQSIEEAFTRNKVLKNTEVGQYTVDFDISGSFTPDDLDAVKRMYKEAGWWSVLLSPNSDGVHCHFTSTKKI